MKTTNHFWAVCVLLGLSAQSQAATTDCIGTAPDARYNCVAPLYQPTTYSACVKTLFSTPETWVTNCAVAQGSIAAGAPRIFSSEGQVTSAVVCALGGPGTISWLSAGQTYSDNVVCTSRTVATVNGVEVRGVGLAQAGSYTIVVARNNVPYCPTDHTAVYTLLNGVQELTACRERCEADKRWVPAANACKPVIEVLRSSKPAPANACVAEVGNPITVFTGAKRETVDTGIRIGGQPLLLTYNSARQLTGDTGGDLPSFGATWFSSLHRKLAPTVSGSAVQAYRGDGTVITFTLSGGVYVADADMNDRLQVVAGGYRYTSATGLAYELYSASGQLTSIASADGTTLTFAYTNGLLTQITDSTGRTVSFGYSGNQVTSITEAGGVVTTAAYAPNGNLTGLTWPDSKTRTFVYENLAFPWALTGVIDERFIRYSTFVYDGAGRAISTEHAGGVEKVSVSYTTPPQAVFSEVTEPVTGTIFRKREWQSPTGAQVTAPNGQSTPIHSASPQGTPVVSGLLQQAGAGSGLASNAQTFDANGNVASFDDFKGVRSCFGYDSSNRNTVSVEGLSNTVVCSTVTAANATLPIGARKTSTQWHPDWRLVTKLAAPSVLTTIVFNGQPDPFAANAIASCAPPTALLPSGAPIVVPCKVVKQATTDSNGALGFGAPLKAGVASRQQTFTYDMTGNVLTANGERTDVNDTTTFTYATATTSNVTKGDLIQVTNALGHVTQFTQYTPRGQLLQEIDPNGNSTLYTYDARQRLTSVTTAGQQTLFAYDAAGQLLLVTRPDATTVSYTWDDAHRLTRVTDARGNSIQYLLDPSGYRLEDAYIDAQGVTVQKMLRSFDALGRVQQATGGR